MPAPPNLPPPPASTPPVTPPKQQSRTSTIVGAVVALLVVGLVVMCASGAFKSDKSSSLPGADASAKVSCGHFRNVANDASKGVLGVDQLLPKMREVYDSARVSDNIRVRTAAQEMLAAITADRDATVQVNEMSAACTAIGE
jgi:hypothetical protein